MVDPKKTAARLAQELRTTFGGGLRSVVLFGSVARGEVVPGVSDVNILDLLDEVGPRQLAAAAPRIQEWIRRGNTPPHVYSMHEWNGMRDTFAIEIVRGYRPNAVELFGAGLTIGALVASNLLARRSERRALEEAAPGTAELPEAA